jgi:glucose/arabinose dehydrogenase
MGSLRSLIQFAAVAVVAVVAARLASAAGATGASQPTPPFSDFRAEHPGNSHRITAADLPEPYASKSASNPASKVRRPPNALPSAPPGFSVNVFAENLVTPRAMRIAPNGDVFVAESSAGQIRVFHGMAGGKPQQSAIFLDGLNRPYGIAFYPVGPQPQWIYIGDTDAVLRVPYDGGLHAAGPAEKLLTVASGGGHWTRDLRFSQDGTTLFVAVGSGSNIGDPDVSPDERFRANILAFAPDGSHQRVYAAGLRNPSGIAIDPLDGRLWCAVNERDGLGDNLVPDYITAVRENGFYGWPWWYIGAHQDPRLAGKHPELRQQVILPDVLLQPHDAPLQLEFYQGSNFPPAYRGDIFATSHGSWNRSVRTGYEVIRVPRHQTSHAGGDYEDFLTGFVLPNGDVWGRPVGVVTASDGSLLVSDDASNIIWRVVYGDGG